MSTQDNTTRTSYSLNLLSLPLLQIVSSSSASAASATIKAVSNQFGAGGEAEIGVAIAPPSPSQDQGQIQRGVEARPQTQLGAEIPGQGQPQGEVVGGVRIPALKPAEPGARPATIPLEEFDTISRSNTDDSVVSEVDENAATSAAGAAAAAAAVSVGVGVMEPELMDVSMLEKEQMGGLRGPPA